MKIINIIMLVIFLGGFGSIFLSMASPPEKHSISITVSDMSVDSVGHVIAVGVLEYTYITTQDTTQGNSKIDIRFQITPNTLRFEMWNMNFITKGSYIGTISEDLKTINAVWTTTISGRQGHVLFLRAK